MIVDQAYDLTLDKFSHLPAPKGWQRSSREIQGPDCRYYYRAFCDYAVTRLDGVTGALEHESASARMLQGMVMRHFYLSCLECWRQAQRLWRRYHWRVNGRVLIVCLPSDMQGGRCRKWLQANIPDADPERPGERDRIQMLIDQRFARRSILSLDEMEEKGQFIPAAPDSTCATVEQEVFGKGLAATIAREKAENIGVQRPAIRVLGKDKLQLLIRAIFDSLMDDSYKEADLADRFGLSRPTFSRFAGSRWRSNAGVPASYSIPDLWRNTAQILAGHTVLARVARAVGVWRQVEMIANNDICAFRSAGSHDR